MWLLNAIENELIFICIYTENDISVYTLFCAIKQKSYIVLSMNFLSSNIVRYGLKYEVW